MPENPDINKFQWQQIFNDSTGKTSPSLFCGVIICMSSCGGFTSAGITMMCMILFKLNHTVSEISFFQVMVMQSIAYATIGSALLGIHRLSKDKEVKEQCDPQ